MGGNGSGRPRIDVDLDAAIDLLMRGEPVPAIAGELGINQVTLRNRIAEISKQQNLLLQYRSIQSLQLTEIQARVLEAITPEKIQEAPLRDLVMSFKILKDKELGIEGKPSEIKGLVAHLIYMEQQDMALAEGRGLPPNQFEDAVFDDSIGEETGVFSISKLDNQNF